jgi:hypothetical protein
VEYEDRCDVTHSSPHPTNITDLLYYMYYVNIHIYNLKYKSSLEATKLDHFNKIVTHKPTDKNASASDKGKKGKKPTATATEAAASKKADDDDDEDDSEETIAVRNYLPPPYPGPLLASQVAINAVRTCMRRHKHVGKLLMKKV